MTRSTSTKLPRDSPNIFTCAGFSHFWLNSSLAWFKNALTKTNKNLLGTLHLTSERSHQNTCRQSQYICTPFTILWISLFSRRIAHHCGAKEIFFRYLKQSMFKIYTNDRVLCSRFSVNYCFSSHQLAASQQQGIQDEGGRYINGNVTILAVLWLVNRVKPEQLVFHIWVLADKSLLGLFLTWKWRQTLLKNQLKKA